MTRRLIREGDPPAGQLASPVPQYWNPNTEAFEDVLGAHGAPRAILYGPNGQPISQSNPLEVRARELEAELATMRGLLETGDAKVQLKGRTVEIGGVEFTLHPNGYMLIGDASQRPSAADAITAIGRGVCYWADDTGEVSQASGTEWRSLGVA